MLAVSHIAPEARTTITLYVVAYSDIATAAPYPDAWRLGKYNGRPNGVARYNYHTDVGFIVHARCHIYHVIN